ncbi:MAG TPA: ATP-binding protein, partial [Bacillota bacterium]|nr:ATP-binding protein [Bacillota bacterium]
GPCTIETVHRHADGHDIPVEVSLNYLEFEGREYVGGSARDITERKRAQEALLESEARYRQLVALLPTAVYACNANGELTFYNERAVAIWGRRPSPGETGERFCGCLQALMAAGKAVLREELPLVDACHSGRSFRNVEGIIERPDGSRVNVLVNIDPIRDSEGKVVGAINVLTDITQQKEAEEVLQQQNRRMDRLAREREELMGELRHHAGDLERTVEERTRQLRELVAELEHMSYSIMHDMRAPLRAIQGYATIIQQQEGGHLRAQSRDYLAQMICAADRMDNLITDALSYSRTVRQELPLKPVDVAALLSGMLGSYPEFQQPRADICLEGEFPRVLGNAAGLTQCFSELLGNAVKFVAPGKLPRVRVWAEFRGQEREPGQGQEPGTRMETHQPPMVRLWFEDNGTGIPRDGQQKIFDMFQRMHGSEYEGTGIGLALVRKVAERMGGRVGVESELGKGSRFWIELRAVSC